MTETIEAILRAMQADERAALTAVAEYLAASRGSAEDPRLEVAYAIARQLQLDWPALKEGRVGWRWLPEAPLHAPRAADRWSCELSPTLSYDIAEGVDEKAPRYFAYWRTPGTSKIIGAFRALAAAKQACYDHFDDLLGLDLVSAPLHAAARAPSLTM
jgi:hypothetical protein